MKRNSLFGKMVRYGILALALALAGCTQSANYQQHEQVDMVTQPSGQATDWSLYEDMEGGR